MCFEELLLPIGLDCPEELFGVEVALLTSNSEEVVENSIFICIKGRRYDGHDYIEKALEAGAKVIVAENVRDGCVGGAAILYVDNTRRVASLLYNLWYGNPAGRMKFIGITGTNGKTSVSFMVLEILEAAGFKVGLVGTVEYLSVNRRRIETGAGMTTPDPDTLYSILAQMCEDGAQYVVMEVSSHALVQSRTDAIFFEVAAFTNLSEEHLDFHSDMNDYYKAKKKLFKQSKRAVINVDNEYGRILDRELAMRGQFKKSCSCTAGDFCALDTRITDKGSTYIYVENRDMCNAQRINLKLKGSFQIMNSLQALAIARMCSVDIGVAVRAIEGISGVCGRLEEIGLESDSDIRVFIDYAHTPDALEKLLRSVRAFLRSGERIILVFGCGGDRDKGKRKLMGQIATRLADFCVVTSDNSRSEPPMKIINDILKGINKEKEFAVFESRKEAIFASVIEFARANDTVILAGKGHETYEIDRDGKHPFDERKMVLEALKIRKDRIRQERT